jgi:phosphoglycolate phosphatase-like HAD superfamily hydrolase
MVIVWDLDGPLLNNKKKYHKVLVDSLRMLGLNRISLTEREYWDSKRRRISESESVGFRNEKEHDSFRAVRKALIETPFYLQFDVMQPGATTILRKIKKLGHSNVLLTMRNNSWALENQLIRLGIRKNFDMVLSSDGNDGDWRNKSVLLNGTLLKQRDPNELLLIGDTEGDILASKSIGVKCVAVDYGIRCRELLEPYGPDEIFSDPPMLNRYLTSKVVVHSS